jgi:intein/homing endonuclease
MANGSFKEIQKIQPGDIVRSYDVSTGTTALETVRKLLVRPENPGGYLILNGVLNITGNHRVWVASNRAWQRANTIEIGNWLLGPDGSKIKVSSIEIVEGNFTVYTLELTGPNHNFFSEGMLVHNTK